MATILKGKMRGQEVDIHQWCNDWFTLENGKVVSPLSIRLNPQEMLDVVNSKNNGIMFGLYDLRPDGTFKRIKRRQHA